MEWNLKLQNTTLTYWIPWPWPTHWSSYLSTTLLSRVRYWTPYIKNFGMLTTKRNWKHDGLPLSLLCICIYGNFFAAKMRFPGYLENIGWYLRHVSQYFGPFNVCTIIYSKETYIAYWQIMLNSNWVAWEIKIDISEADILIKGQKSSPLRNIWNWDSWCIQTLSLIGS